MSDPIKDIAKYHRDSKIDKWGLPKNQSLPTRPSALLVLSYIYYLWRSNHGLAMVKLSTIKKNTELEDRTLHLAIRLLIKNGNIKMDVPTYKKTRAGRRFYILTN